MKTLNKYLIESLLDDEEELINNDNTIIERFLKDNYIIKGTYTIKNGIVDIDGNIRISRDVQRDITSLTNDLFEFGTITGDFIVNNCGKLNSLKGGPKKVKGIFMCDYCGSLENFEYAPHEIDGQFVADCCGVSSLKGLPEHVSAISLSDCENLNNLKYIPIADDYNLMGCANLNSLVGLPTNRIYSLDISNCTKLKSLKGCSEKLDYLSIDGCKLDNFKDGPKHILGNLEMNETNIKSLDGFPSIIEGSIYAVKSKLRMTLKRFKDEFIPQNVKNYKNVHIF